MKIKTEWLQRSKADAVEPLNDPDSMKTIYITKRTPKDRKKTAALSMNGAVLKYSHPLANNRNNHLRQNLKE